MKMIIVLLIVICTSLGDSVNAVYSNKSIEGYRASFLWECPGSTKPVVIEKKNLKFIKIYVSGAKTPTLEVGKKRKTYNHKTIVDWANDPSMDWDKRTLFYIPGWMDNIKLPMGPIMERIYKVKGYNVWILEEVTFVIEEFPIAARAVKAIGAHVGELLANLTTLQPKFDPKKLDFLGLSLGGQTMSFIAKSFTKLTGQKVSRLSGMDASGPCFRNRGPEDRIDASDADFVDLVMTNIDGLGMAAPVGHANFYVNGGETQPGDFYWMNCGSVCSHSRGYTIWAASLMFPNSFVGIKCDSVQDARNRNCYDRKPLETNLMGPNADRNKPGIYYVATRNLFPYFLGQAGTKRENDFIMNKLKSLNTVDELRL
ncbi:lipase member H-A [Amyelois transitella]|uniref:lipase member H-A n=1 Tax=Amyelois transitella TaxID=680683 RepID=UPI00299014EC|nr:lipase member H-A [Amyelois transitella]